MRRRGGIYTVGYWMKPRWPVWLKLFWLTMLLWYISFACLALTLINPAWWISVPLAMTILIWSVAATVWVVER